MLAWLQTWCDWPSELTYFVVAWSCPKVVAPEKLQLWLDWPSALKCFAVAYPSWVAVRAAQTKPPWLNAGSVAEQLAEQLGGGAQVRLVDGSADPVAET